MSSTTAASVSRRSEIVPGNCIHCRENPTGITGVTTHSTSRATRSASHSAAR
jgi:hypothetical protein